MGAGAPERAERSPQRRLAPGAGRSEIVGVGEPARFFRMNDVPAEILSSPRVLLVEDEKKTRESVAEGLRMELWDVTAAADGGEATGLLERGAFDLIVLDTLAAVSAGADENSAKEMGVILERARAVGKDGSDTDRMRIASRGQRKRSAMNSARAHNHT